MGGSFKRLPISISAKSAELIHLISKGLMSQAAKTEIDRFAGFYASELNRTGFRPDASSNRDTRIDFLQQTVKRFCSPLLSMKRASPARPISDEVVVYVQTREFRDFLRSGGTANYEVILTDNTEHLPPDQLLVNPLNLATLAEPITAVPTVPGCTGPVEPTPEPVPVPLPTPSFPYPDEPTIGKAYQTRVKATYTEAKRAFPDPNDPDAFRHFMRYGYSCHEMSAPDASNKHIAELRRDLGLPEVK